MKRATLMLAALTLLVGSVGQARAQYNYSFTYNDGYGDSGTGMLTLPTTGAGIASTGSLDLTSSFGSTAFTGTYTLVSSGTTDTGLSGPFDNMVYPGNDALGSMLTGYLTSSGLLFQQQVTSGPGAPYYDYVNLYDNQPAISNGYDLEASVKGVEVTGGPLDSGIFTLNGPLNSVPEPSGIALLGLGVVCLAIGYAVRRRKLALVAA